MFVVHINIQVRPEYIEEFKQICIENAQNSVKELGIKRFDVLQQSENPTHFVLVEAYTDETGVVHHKQTAHYNKWRSEAERMILGERTRTKFTPIWPEKY
ncbi:MAG: antibiotic biosynthesis monooxygenase [Phycisphaerae bacterium]|jgi:quinol monooxygenase YgiN